MRTSTKGLIGGLLFVALLFSLGEAMATDVPNASDTDNTLGATVSSDSPVISAFDIKNATLSSFLHSQLDVSTTAAPAVYYFNVTVEDANGWADLQWVNIRIWFDGGTEVTFDSQSTGANYRADLNYTNVAPLSDPAVGEWSVTEGNIAYNSTDSAIYTNTANQNYTFNLSFELDPQIRQAIDPVNSGTGNYDDANSWNVEIRARDSDNPDVINRTNATGVYHEFGVFQFTSVSIGANWDAGTIAPGGSGTTSVVTVTHQSNRDYRMKVWFDTELDSGTDTIAVTNIDILAAGDANDAITSDTAFAGLGEANSVYIHGSASTNRSHNVSSDQETTGVQYRVNVPFGTPSGSYVATLTIKVEQP